MVYFFSDIVFRLLIEFMYENFTTTIIVLLGSFSAILHDKDY